MYEAVIGLHSPVSTYKHISEVTLISFLFLYLLFLTFKRLLKSDKKHMYKLSQPSCARIIMEERFKML